MLDYVASRDPAYTIDFNRISYVWGGFRSRMGTKSRADPPTIQMHIVLVLVTVRPEMAEEFTAALLHNARESVAHDPGCIRFDVSQQQDDPARWILYEAYESPDAHAVHRQSPHFLAYDAIAARAVIDKTVLKASSLHFTLSTKTS